MRVVTWLPSSHPKPVMGSRQDRNATRLASGVRADVTLRPRCAPRLACCAGQCALRGRLSQAAPKYCHVLEGAMCKGFEAGVGVRATGC